MLNVFFRFGRIISTFLITIILLFCYANLPEDIAYIFNDDGVASAFTTKPSFFYTAAGIVFIINIMFLLLKNALLKLNYKTLLPNSAWTQSSASLPNLFSAWIDAFLLAINLFAIFAILGLNNINSRKDQSLDFNYNLLLMLGAVVLLILIFFVPLRVLFTNPKPEN